MSATKCAGPRCDAPTTSGLVLCKNCQRTARVGVTNVGTYHGELLSLGAQTSRTRRGGGISDPTGSLATTDPSVQTNAADIAAAETKVELLGWINVYVDDRPTKDHPHDTVVSMAAFLAARTTSIATLEWAGEYLRGVIKLEHSLRSIVERGKGKWYAGICSTPLEGTDGERCMRDLYASPTSPKVRCPTCGAQHSVADRRSILIEEARETMLPLGTIAQVCVTLLEGEPSVERLFKRIHNWVRRGDLQDYGVRVLGDGRPHRVYRLGDVLDTLIGDVSKTKRGVQC